MVQNRQRVADSKLLEAAMVARRYYLGNRQKNEIAEEFGISRFKVARLLDEAMAAGLVRIEVDVPTSIDLELGERVAERFGLRRVIAARTLDGSRDSVTPVIAAACANYLTTALDSHDLIGLSWGRTLTAMVEAFNAPSGSNVVQIAGGINSGRTEVGGVELVRRMAEKTGGRAFPLLAPLYVQSPDVAADLRRDPSVAETIHQFPKLTKAVLTIGSWNPPNSATYESLLPEERTRLLESGAVGDFFGVPFDRSGAVVDFALQQRAIGITADQLSAVPEVVAVAGGDSKSAAIASVLRSGLVSTLITDTSSAAALLALHDAERV